MAVKLAEKSNPLSSLSIWWITITKTSVLLIRVTEWIELNWLCKHMKNIESSQPAIPCTELSRTQLFPERSLKLPECLYTTSRVGKIEWALIYKIVEVTLLVKSQCFVFLFIIKVIFTLMATVSIFRSRGSSEQNISTSAVPL